MRSTLCLLFLFAGPTFAKDPVPAAAEQERAKKLILDLFQDDWAAAKDSPAKARLAGLFLQEAEQTKDEPAGKHQLLDLARQLAVEAGDVPLSYKALDQLYRNFELPTDQLHSAKIQILLQISHTAVPEYAYAAVVDHALSLLQDSLDRDDFALGKKLLDAAERSARNMRDIVLVSRLQKRAAQVAEFEKEFATWKPFADRLAKNPNDPEANEAIGSYQALTKGNWSRALPMLAKGPKTSPLALAAQAEIGKGTPEAIADLWTQALASKKSPQVALHAYQWHQRALGGSNPAAAEKKLLALRDLLPADQLPGEIAREVSVTESPDSAVHVAALSPDNRRLVYPNKSGSLVVVDARTNKIVGHLNGHQGRVLALAFVDNETLASGGHDGTIRIWDVDAGKEKNRLPGHGDYVRSLAVSADGQFLLSGGDDSLVRLWHIETGKELLRAKGHEHFVFAVAISPDGTRALSGSLDHTVRLWDIKNGRQLATLEGHDDPVMAVAFSPNGQKAISGSTDQTLAVWDLAALKKERTLTGHTGYVHSAAFSPDGRRVLSASQDKTLRLWDVGSGEELRTLPGHRDQVWFVNFSRDGLTAISAGQDRTVRLWGTK